MVELVKAGSANQPSRRNLNSISPPPEEYLAAKFLCLRRRGAFLMRHRIIYDN